MIRDVLAKAGLAVADLDRLAVTVGPGSFTGIRVGLAAAQGLALALALPCVGITNLEALAASTSVDERAEADLILVTIDSKRGDIFAQLFDRALCPMGEPWAAGLEATARAIPAGQLIVVGDAAKAVVTALRALGRNARLGDGGGAADPAVVAAVAAGRPSPGALPPRPLYLRSADTTAPDR